MTYEDSCFQIGGVRNVAQIGKWKLPQKCQNDRDVELEHKQFDVLLAV